MFTCPVSTFSNTSFSPEKRAEAQSQYLADALKAIDAEVARLAADPKAQPIDPDVIVHMKTSHATAYNVYWSSLSRTASPMITGPANFPTARNRKALDAAAKRYENIETHFKAITKRLIKLAYPTGQDGDPIRSNDPEAVAKLRAKLDSLKAYQELMKATNALIRKYGKSNVCMDELRAIGLSEGQLIDVLNVRGNNWWGLGFAPWQLTNNNATIRATQDRLTGLENSLAKPSKELSLDGLTVITNREAQRIQLFFNGKPDPDTIKLLKSKAFKWAPSIGAWQRQITSNAIYATREVLNQLGHDFNSALA